jgi:hypothetical protein
MKTRLEQVLCVLGLAAAVSCSRLFSLSTSEMMLLAAPSAQQTGHTVYLPAVETDYNPCWPYPMTSGACIRGTAADAPAQATPEPTQWICRPPCWVDDGICTCVAGDTARFSVFLPHTARNTELRCDGQWIDGACIRRYSTCPGRMVGNICVIGP